MYWDPTVTNPEHIKFVKEEVTSHSGFTNHNFALVLCLVGQVQAYLSLSGKLNPKNDLSSLIDELGVHIKFLYDDNQASELFFLSRASKYLGVIKLGNKDTWGYLKSRFTRLFGAATHE